MKGGLLLLAIVCALLLGCPLDVADNPASPSGGNSGSTGTGPVVGPPAPGSPQNGATSGGAGTSTHDPLEIEFPGCTRPANADTWQLEVLDLINQERATQGLLPLEGNETLHKQAEQYACEMIYYNFFGHENPVTGSTLPDRAAEFGYSYVAIGENLAAGQNSPAEVVSDWMNSPGHRANILSPYFTQAGVGVRAGGTYRLYWVVEFGQPWP